MTDIELSKKGITLKWSYLAVILGGFLSAAIAPYIGFTFQTRAAWQQHQDHDADLTKQVEQLTERVQTCEANQKFLLEQWERERDRKIVAPNSFHRYRAATIPEGSQ